MDKSTYTILLTACIDPGGMLLTNLIDPAVRKSQYVEALEFYLKNTDYPIVFTENSGNDVSDLFQDEIRSGRLEVLTFEGNKEKTKGKGYGECEIIEYALDHSLLINQGLEKAREKGKKLMVMKITGRLIVENFMELIQKKSPFQHDEDFICGVKPFRRMAASSEIFLATCSLLRELVNRKEWLDDAKGYWLEHLIVSVAMDNKCIFFPFDEIPIVHGISGSKGKDYEQNRHRKKEQLEYWVLSYNSVFEYYRRKPSLRSITLGIPYKLMSIYYSILLKIFLTKQSSSSKQRQSRLFLLG